MGQDVPSLVEQCDREAAASIAVLVEMRDLILSGRADHHAEPFARHRLAATEHLQAESEMLKETVRRMQASARTLDATRAQIYEYYVKNSAINHEAVASLDSEREANAILTAELDRLKEALRFYATPNNYCRSSMFINSTAYSAIDRDEGAKARDAMGETTK